MSHFHYQNPKLQNGGEHKITIVYNVGDIREGEETNPNTTITNKTLKLYQTQQPAQVILSKNKRKRGKRSRWAGGFYYKKTSRPTHH